MLLELELLVEVDKKRAEDLRIVRVEWIARRPDRRWRGIREAYGFLVSPRGEGIE